MDDYLSLFSIDKDKSKKDLVDFNDQVIKLGEEKYDICLNFLKEALGLPSYIKSLRQIKDYDSTRLNEDVFHKALKNYKKELQDTLNISINRKHCEINNINKCLAEIGYFMVRKKVYNEDRKVDKERVYFTVRELK